jgi:hypothetical protein
VLILGCRVPEIAKPVLVKAKSNAVSLERSSALTQRVLVVGRVHCKIREPEEVMDVTLAAVWVAQVFFSVADLTVRVGPLVMVQVVLSWDTRFL